MGLALHSTTFTEQATSPKSTIIFAITKHICVNRFIANVLSELKRPSPSYRVLAFVTGCPLDELYISTVTLAEIRFGIGLIAEPVRRTELEQWLQNRVRPMFANHVVAITEDVLFRWRNLAEDGRKAGRTYSEPDLMLAATALGHDLILVTRNVRDFEGLGLTLLNPWETP